MKFKFGTGDLVIIKPDRMDDYKHFSILGLIEKTGTVILYDKYFSDVFVESRVYKIPNSYLRKIVIKGD